MYVCMYDWLTDCPNLSYYQSTLPIYWLWIHPHTRPFRRSFNTFFLSFLRAVQSINQSISDHRFQEIVIVGHSLGGGIARIAGSVLGRPSIAFSPPGVRQSRAKLFGTTTSHSSNSNSNGARTTGTGNEDDDDDRSSSSITRNGKHNTFHRSVSIIPEHDPVAMVDAQSGALQVSR